MDEYKQLLETFDLLPKEDIQPTYLGLCKYPYSRFEEICSRLLCFYFSPDKEHGLGDLFLRSLLNLLDISDKVSFNFNDVKVISEDNAEGKRLDILIYSNEFVIGIENKITANLYNPLEIYKNRIGLYSQLNIYKAVLSLRRIQNVKEKKLMEQHGFINITYQQLFDVVSSQIITKENDPNNKYILFLKDFIKTLTNMSGQNVLNKELSDFFYNNSNKINELISLYEKFNQEILNQQKRNIAIIKTQIETQTAHVWWLWHDYLLGTEKANQNKIKIGLEASYEATKEDALGEFYFQFVTWSLNDWNAYENSLLKRFPHSNIQKTNTKCTLSLTDVVFGNDESEILSKLNHYFLLLDEIILETNDIEK